MFSQDFIFLLQFGQWDAGKTIDSFLGIRHINTLKNDPNKRPRSAIKTMVITTPGNYR
jgi:hypothetical protein